MADSTRDALLATWREWKSSNPEFPLFVAANGQWAKRVRGKVHYFGRLDDPDFALAAWKHDGP